MRCNLFAADSAAAGAAEVIQLHWLDISIIVGYIVLILVIGWMLSKRASKDLDSYFLGGKSLPWWVIGTSHGASGFDITGTMWFVAMLFTYGLKAAWIPWIWPLFDRVFRQVYLGPWIRRSNVLTGAEWMRTRFGTGIEWQPVAYQCGGLCAGPVDRLSLLRLSGDRQVRRGLLSLGSVDWHARQCRRRTPLSFWGSPRPICCWVAGTVLC